MTPTFTRRISARPPSIDHGGYGFETSYGYLRGQIDPYTHRYKFGDHVTWHRNDEFIEEEGHVTDLITDEAIRVITSAGDNPFFLYVAHHSPHYPLNEPPTWIAPYEKTIDDVWRRHYAAAATHQGFMAPDSCVAPDLWAFESEAVTPAGSYSPLTTPFGYFGTGFDADGKVAPGASFNFSMWLAGRNATSAPPIDQMPFLFATGIPEADFETFHHEGTGVKLRNAVAHPDGAARVIQAMRLSFEKGRHIFYGHYFDKSESRWKLFAAGSKAQAPGRREPDLTRGLLRRTGSFVEIPGPPARERSGDVVRVVRRRGWFIDRDLSAHRAVMESPRGELAAARAQLLRALTEGKTENAYTSRFSYYLEDFACEGWIASRTGGVENHLAMAMRRDPAEVPRGRSARLPEYLQPAKLAELSRLPVTFGEPKIKNIIGISATIGYPIEATGPNSRAVLYFGTVDALTYPPRNVTGGSPALREMFSPQRTWQHAITETKVTTGPNEFQLNDLKPGTTYHFRLYVEHDEGQSWDLRSGSFQTDP